MVRIDQIINIRFYFHIFARYRFFIRTDTIYGYNLRGDQVTRIESFFMSKTVCELVLGFKIHQLIPIKLVRTNITPKTFLVTNLSKRQDCLKITLVQKFRRKSVSSKISLLGNQKLQIKLISFQSLLMSSGLRNQISCTEANRE